MGKSGRAFFKIDALNARRVIVKEVLTALADAVYIWGEYPLKINGE